MPDKPVRLQAYLARAGIASRRASEELILWMSPRFGFIDLPDRFCTGSSIMPQKKNPDVPELARGLFGSFLGAIRGGSQYRRASFLLDAAGRADADQAAGMIFPEDRTILSMALGRENVVHVALTDPAAAARVRNALARWRAFTGPDRGLEGGQPALGLGSAEAVLTKD